MPSFDYPIAWHSPNMLVMMSLLLVHEMLWIQLLQLQLLALLQWLLMMNST
jgi:hypothetical protein